MIVLVRDWIIHLTYSTFKNIDLLENKSFFKLIQFNLFNHFVKKCLFRKATIACFYDGVIESISQPIHLKLLIHSIMNQLIVLMCASLTHSFRQFIQKHKIIQEQNTTTACCSVLQQFCCGFVWNHFHWWSKNRQNVSYLILTSCLLNCLQSCCSGIFSFWFQN